MRSWILGGGTALSMSAGCVAEPGTESPFEPSSTPGGGTGSSSGPPDVSGSSAATEPWSESTASVESTDSETSGGALDDGPSTGESAESSTDGAGSTGPERCVEPPPGLMAWWRGEGDASDAVGGHDAYPSPGLGYGPGLVGQALVLDGDDTAMVPSNAPLLPAGDFSIEGWIRTDGVEEYGNIVSTYECGSVCVSMESSSQFFLRVNDTHVLGLAIRDTDGASQGIGGTTDLTDGRFHHVAGVRDVAGGRLLLYVDGVVEADVPLVATGVLEDVDGDDDPVIIGAQYGPADTTPDRHFVGEIDELSLYASALDGATIQAIHDAGSLGKCIE